MRDNWFAKTPAWLLLDEGLDSKEKLVFTVLGLFADSQNRCFPSIQRLAKICSYGRESVKRALKGLEEKGLILKKFRYEKNVQTTTLYSLAKRRYEPPEPPPAGSHRAPGRLTQSPPSAHTEPQVGSQGATEQNQLTEPYNRARGTAPPEFSEKGGEKIGDRRQSEIQNDDGVDYRTFWENLPKRRRS